jgi:hypothetical protein
LNGADAVARAIMRSGEIPRSPGLVLHFDDFSVRGETINEFIQLFEVVGFTRNRVLAPQQIQKVLTLRTKRWSAEHVSASHLWNFRHDYPSPEFCGRCSFTIDQGQADCRRDIQPKQVRRES